MKRLVSRLWQLVPRDPKLRIHSLLMMVLLCGAFFVRAGDVRASLPYARHPDEVTWANIALRMIQSGDPNPHRFRKPSLPVYLMASGFSVGFLRAKWAGDVYDVEDLGTSSQPYYLAPSAAEVPKLLFTLCSVLALGLAGTITYRLTNQAAALWLTPLLASASASYYRLSWSYMNVDIVGALFAFWTIAYLVRVRARGGPVAGAGMRHAVVAGVLAGLTVGSKYNLFPILLPCVLFFALFERQRFVVRTLVTGLVSVATFFVTTPFAIFDYPTFISHVVKEAQHYASGHVGATVDRGFPMAWTYVSLFQKNFGALPLLLSLCGVGYLARRDWKLTLVVLSFPLSFVAYMCLQRVFFERNVVAVHLFVAMGLAVALLELPGLLARAASRRFPVAERAAAPWIAGAVLVALTLVSLPWERIARAYSSGDDARNLAVQWVRRHVPKKALVLVDGQLAMDARPLAQQYEVLETRLPRDLKRIEALGKGKNWLVLISDRKQRRQYMQLIPGSRARAHFVQPHLARRVLTIVERRPR